VTLKARVRGLSDIGIVREENQDSLAIQEPPGPEATQQRGTLVALADGMGGLEEGSTASRLAVDTIVREYYGGRGSPRESLQAAIQGANRAIFRHSRDHQDGRQMGSTVTALAILENYACIGQVGDSRAYHYRNGSLRQVTRDHSLVRELADRGEIDESYALYSFHRNVLTRGLGLHDEVEVDMYELRALEAGDTFLLCTDGLHALLAEDEISACLERFGANPQEACAEFVRIARERGAPDNITVALILLEEDGAAGAASAAAEGSRPSARKARSWTWLLPLLVIASFAAGVVSTLLLEKPAPGEQAMEKVREEVEKALEPAGAAEGDPARVERLEKHLKAIRSAVEK
jgi:protein phosphatase